MERGVEEVAGRKSSWVSWGETRNIGKIQWESQKERQRARRVESWRDKEKEKDEEERQKERDNIKYP